MKIVSLYVPFVSVMQQNRRARECLSRGDCGSFQDWISCAISGNRLSTSFHYTFADYVNAIVKSGLSIQEVQEPLPPETWKQTCPERYESFAETPTYLILKLGMSLCMVIYCTMVPQSASSLPVNRNPHLARKIRGLEIEFLYLSMTD